MWRQGRSAEVVEVSEARLIATRLLIDVHPRWLHVQGVGALAERLRRLGAVSDWLVVAAWLHDIGYATDLAKTGLHPLDGARYLQGRGTAASVVALVALHTGADTEARVRGLEDQLTLVPSADPGELDVLTLLDMSIGPEGRFVTPEDRLAEVLVRHPPESPVHVSRSLDRNALLAASARAVGLLERNWRSATGWTA